MDSGVRSLRDASRGVASGGMKSFRKGGRKIQEPALFEFVDQASGGKGFQLPSMGLPSPVPANVLGEFMPAPLRVLGNQIAQPGKIRWEDVPTLTSNRFIHGPDYAMGGVVSSGKSGYRKMA